VIIIKQAEEKQEKQKLKMAKELIALVILFQSLTAISYFILSFHS